MHRLEYLKRRFSEERLAQKFDIVLEELEEGFVSVSYRADPDDCVTNDHNQSIVQGGVLVGVLADFAAVYAAMSSIPNGHTLLMFGSFSLHRPTLVGDVVRAEALVFNASKRTISVSVHIFDAEWKLKCEGTYHFSHQK